MIITKLDNGYTCTSYEYGNQMPPMERMYFITDKEDLFDRVKGFVGSYSIINNIEEEHIVPHKSSSVEIRKIANAFLIINGAQRCGFRAGHSVIQYVEKWLY